jgi:putative spermidine/putrescine transport system ATP-binding protein
VPSDLETHGASIALRGLTKKYGDVTAVEGINLQARPGEFLTLLGPSGSGKTTTLNMIAGFEPITAGELLIDDKPVHALPSHRREIGMVFQHYALFPHMSVQDNVAYPLRQRKIGRAERKHLVAQALEAVGLAHLGHRKPRQLSGGQHQRVALARAMVYGPRVLLMDEPLGALDKKLRDSLQLEIKRIHAELGTTFVYVTHDQDEALVLSDRVAVFNSGRIEQIGSAKELYERPQTMFVSQFLGESSVFHGIAQPSPSGSAVMSAAGMLHAVRGDVRPGERAALVLRPERLRVLPADGPVPDGNKVRGRVTQEIYLGSSRKLEISLLDGAPVLARESFGAASASRPGDEVWVTFRPEDAVVLPVPASVEPGSDDAPARFESDRVQAAATPPATQQMKA